MVSYAYDYRLIAAFQLSYYLAYAIGAFMVARRFGREDAWMAFVPFLNIYLICDMARKETSFTVMAIVFTFVCGIVGVIMVASAWADIAVLLGKDTWYGWLTIIPLINLVPIFILASGEPVVRGGGGNTMLRNLPDGYRQNAAYQQAAAWEMQQGYPQGGYPPQGAYAPPMQQGYPAAPDQAGMKAPQPPMTDPFVDPGSGTGAPPEKKPYIPPKGWV